MISTKYHSRLIVAAALTFVYLTAASSHADTATPFDTSKTLTAYIFSHLVQLAPPGYAEQQRTCNAFQRAGCINVTFELVAGDGMSSIIQLMKNDCEIAFGMPHIAFEIQPDPATARALETLGIKLKTVPLPDNWDFPDDPWKREWWTLN